MSDIFKPISDDAVTGSGAASTPGSIYTSADPYAPAASNEAGRTVLAGLLGGVASAVGYIVYSRLPEDQKVKLQAQVRSLVESRINELRSRFNV
jgi:hypothetical protein